MLFKEALNEKAEEIKKYLPVTVVVSFGTIKPFIDIAEMAYLKPLIGSELYAKLQTFYTNQSSGSTSGDADVNEAYTELLKLSQRAIINLAYYRGFSTLNTTITDDGFQRAESDRYKTLYKYQEDEIKAQFKTDGFNTLDDILQHLEDNLEYYPEFEESENYLEVKEMLIPSTKVFDKYYNIGKSRLVFLKLQQFIMQAEDFEIKKTLGASLYAYVKAEIIKDEPEEKATNLLTYIRKALAYFAVAYGINELGVNITDKMVYFESSEPNTANSTKKSPVSDNKLEVMANKASHTANLYLEDLKQYLITNAATYTTYSGQTGSVYHGRDNADKKTFFA